MVLPPLQLKDNEEGMGLGLLVLAYCCWFVWYMDMGFDFGSLLHALVLFSLYFELVGG